MDHNTKDPAYPFAKESRSKRVHILMKPSLHEKLNEYADQNGDSLNNLVHSILEEFVRKNNL